MVTAYVIMKRIGRYGKDYVLKFLQIMYSCHFFLCCRIDEHEIAKTEVFRYGFAQIYIHFLGVLVNEYSLALIGILTVIFFRRLQNQRNKRIMLANFLK